jgi:signal transduction histidine kinase
MTWIAQGEGRRYTQADVELAAEVARRLAQALVSARLYRQAQEAVAERDRLFTVATHDLRNALTGLLGQAQLLQRRAERDGLSEQNRRAARTIAEQAARLDRMISSLLDLSRMREGQLRIDRSEVEVCALVERLVAALQPTLSQHTLALSRPAEPLAVLGDMVRLEQVVQNLLSNAIKYSPAGGPVAVEITREGGAVALAVSDRGIGVPAAAVPRLFERFFRAENATAQAATSMGVGLYVVKEIVELHGGTVAVETAEGHGSRFTVRLPLARV